MSVLSGEATGDGQPQTAFSRRFDEALALAAAAHHGSDRKGTKIPYIAHPMHVSRILDRCGYGEDIVIAALFHDVLEDVEFWREEVRARCVGVAPELKNAPSDAAGFRQAFADHIAARFGKQVVDLVWAVTEKKSDEQGNKRKWHVRKEEQLRHLASAGPDLAALKAADTLHNANAILADLERDPSMLSRFNAPPEQIAWWYETVTESLSRLLPSESMLLRELQDAAGRLVRRIREIIQATV